MLGAIYGDIIGSVFEWHNVKTENFELFSRESHFTYDTVLTVAVMDKLLSSENKHSTIQNRLTAKTYAERYIAYYNRYRDAGYGQMFTERAQKHTFNKSNSYGNGSAMRSCPIGYAYEDLHEVLKETQLSSLYTHNSREAIRAVKAVAGCVFLARKGVSKIEIFMFVTKISAIKYHSL